MIQLQIRVGFSSWRAGSGQGAAYVISMFLLCAHVSPFPEEVKVFKSVFYFRFS